jgi:hypothetical protein
MLDTATDQVPPAAIVAERLGELAARAGWPALAPDSVVAGERRALLGTLSADGAHVIRVGLHEDGLLVAGRHDALDGLALLACAEHLLGVRLRSAARGVGERVGAGRRALIERAWEVAARPPARVAPASLPLTAAVQDAFARTTLDATPRTADLVLAGARAVARWNADHGTSARRVCVAVGVSTVGGDTADLADRSGFLRLRDVERLEPDDVRAALASAPLQPGAGAARRPSALLGAVVRLAAPRLGSTLLVSHIGSIEADSAVSSQDLYPLSGGGSGLSLGAVTIRGLTTVTLRARGRTHDDQGLEQLLALVVDAIG